MGKWQYVTPAPGFGDIVIRGIENNAPRALAITGAFALTIAGILGYQIYTHTPEMHPGSPAWKEAHKKEANSILAGDMGPVDFMTRIMLGKEAYARDMKAAFGQEIQAAEERAPTAEELKTIENLYASQPE